MKHIFGVGSSIAYTIFGVLLVYGWLPEIDEVTFVYLFFFICIAYLFLQGIQVLIMLLSSVVGGMLDNIFSFAPLIAIVLGGSSVWNGELEFIVLLMYTLVFLIDIIIFGTMIMKKFSLASDMVKMK